MAFLVLFSPQVFFFGDSNLTIIDNIIRDNRSSPFLVLGIAGVFGTNCVCEGNEIGKEVRTPYSVTVQSDTLFSYNVGSVKVVSGFINSSFSSQALANGGTAAVGAGLRYLEVSGGPFSTGLTIPMPPNATQGQEFTVLFDVGVASGLSYSLPTGGSFKTPNPTSASANQMHYWVCGPSQTWHRIVPV